MYLSLAVTSVGYCAKNIRNRIAMGEKAVMDKRKLSELCKFRHAGKNYQALCMDSGTLCSRDLTVTKADEKLLETQKPSKLGSGEE